MQKEHDKTTIRGNEKLDPHLWVSNYADYLYSYAILRIEDVDLAKDLVQETFLAALERSAKFEGRSSEKTWLTSILKNKIIDVYRQKSSAFAKDTNITKAEQEQDDFFDNENGHWNDEHRPKDFGIEEADALENKEFQQILSACMKKLPKLWLSVFTMKHMDDESTAYICSELRVSSSNFWVIIHRAKVNLRSCLQKNWLQN
ncbi:sigma-70 family RNA polymerase sigma factor [Pedobacter antarcticus]|uniref:sigma-70 family RNA polymerase sigma factor n=1 Tax=Pedobacter antarcticus TaxID=34086 RepID=UPI00292D140B|nr:sigma-70 family RNA polymerase sigma factor [Pedobacter antarcticus]